MVSNLLHRQCKQRFLLLTLNLQLKNIVVFFSLLSFEADVFHPWMSKQRRLHWPFPVPVCEAAVGI